MAEKKDIYYHGRIYTGITDSNMPLINLLKINGNTVIGTHSFKDGQDVTGLWTVQYQCQCGRKEKHTINHCENVVMVAVPKSISPPDELDREANKLVEMFIEYAHSNWHEVHGFDEQDRFNNAKKCATIHCDLIVSHGTPNQIKRYTTLKQKIESL